MYTVVCCEKRFVVVLRQLYIFGLTLEDISYYTSRLGMKVAGALESFSDMAFLQYYEHTVGAGSCSSSQSVQLAAGFWSSATCHERRNFFYCTHANIHHIPVHSTSTVLPLLLGSASASTERCRVPTTCRHGSSSW